MTPNLQFGSEAPESNYAILLSIFGTVPLLLMVLLCTCWKRTRQKDELMGLPGIVTPKNPEELTDDIIAKPILNGLITIDIVVDDVDSNKRPTSLTQHRRSLPDIPIPDLTLHCDPNDNSSDLYDTVHHPYNIGGSSITDQPTSQPDDPYSRVESNSKRTENPYAVVNENTNKSNEINNYEIEGTISAAAKLLLPSTSQIPPTAHGANHPHAPPPLPLPSPTNSLSSSMNNSCQQMTVDAAHNPATDNISAARAMRGDWAASQELPYITPPNVTGGGGAQVNFSGDSQDSSKGYTSITVRAPLKDIRKDAPYSDDSDEMYQTIPDQSNYTSGSETYAQIQPQITVAVEINNQHLQEQANLDYINETNAAASTESSSKVAQHSHSRQGSNSSSIQNISSPKPERRPVNSPLPPTPSSVAASLDKPIQNLNDMYAKVNKKPKRNDLDESKNPSTKLASTPPVEQVSDKTYVRKIEHNYETIKTSPKKNSQQQNSLDSDPGYEKLQPRTANAAEPATLDLSDPNYEQLRPKSPTSSSLQHPANNSTTSSVNSACQQQQLTVDGYSVIRHQGRQSTQSSVSSDILTRNSLDEPNYESMPNSENSDLSCDLNVEQPQKELLNVEYKRLHSNSDDCDSLKRLRDKVTNRSSNTSKSSGLADLSSATSNSDDLIDPNYESLNKSNQDEPNYESVKYDDVDTKALMGEEDKLLGKQEVEGYDDGYEKIRKNSGKTDKRKSDNPDYETIGRQNKSHLGDADDFFEV